MSAAITRLSDLSTGEEGDFFAMLASREALTTKDGKPYYRCSLRDVERELPVFVWSDSPHFKECDLNWQVGLFFKVRATLRETSFGQQLDVRRIRPTTAADADDGFDPAICVPRSRYSTDDMVEELNALVGEIEDGGIRQLVEQILTEHGELFTTMPAAKRNHHAFASGLLEHVLSVTKTCCYLAEKYGEYYTELDPPLDKDLLIAGAILHDIGKVRELRELAGGCEYTVSGQLIGHILQGRDIVREAARDLDVDEEKLLRLEHIILSHQRLPEWGSPKPPMTPEALLIHYADDMDAKFHMMVRTIVDDPTDEPMTSHRNPLGMPLFKGCE